MPARTFIKKNNNDHVVFVGYFIFTIKLQEKNLLTDHWTEKSPFEQSHSVNDDKETNRKRIIAKGNCNVIMLSDIVKREVG